MKGSGRTVLLDLQWLRRCHVGNTENFKWQHLATATTTFLLSSRLHGDELVHSQMLSSQMKPEEVVKPGVVRLSERRAFSWREAGDFQRGELSLGEKQEAKPAVGLRMGCWLYLPKPRRERCGPGCHWLCGPGKVMLTSSCFNKMPHGS